MIDVKVNKHMHTRQKRKQKPLQHAWLFALPQDCQSVKLRAFECAITDAYRQGEKAGDVHTRAAQRCQQYRNSRANGKSGTNNPAMFNELFLPTYTHAHAAMMRLSKRADAITRLSAIVGVEALCAYLHDYTEAHPDLVEAAFVGESFDLAPMTIEEVTHGR